MAHVRQSRPDFGLGFQVNALDQSEVVGISLGSGRVRVSVSCSAFRFVYRFLGLRFRVSGSRSRVPGVGYLGAGMNRIEVRAACPPQHPSTWFRVSWIGFRISWFGFRISGFESRISDFGFWV